jgi:O-antigen biosynthesis protein
MVNLDIDKSIAYSLDGCSDEVLKDYGLVYFSRLNGIFNVVEQVERLKRLGIKYIVDIDDYWVLPSYHLLCKLYKSNKVADRIKYIIHHADYVTTTTDKLAERIKPINPKVEVVVNAIDPDQPQWELKEKNTDLTFGWIGSIHHYIDLKLLESEAPKMQEAGMNLLLAGKVDHMVWDLYEDWFTKNGRYSLSAINYSDVYSYALAYDHIDVALIPLHKDTFNSCKSELKMIEAGFKKKAVIVSEVSPYTNLITKDNSLTGSFYNNAKLLRDNPELRKELAYNLYDNVKDKYHIKEANKVRLQIINSL